MSIEYPKKMHVLLDLDLTCICSEPTEEMDFEKHKKRIAENFNFHDIDGYYICVERPYLQDFLDYLFKHFNVSVFTAASKDYAIFIIEHIILADSKRKLNYIFFDYHCDISEKHYKGQKDLRLLWDRFNLPEFSEESSLLIDDYSHNKKIQPNNCYRIKEFRFLEEDSESDNALKDIENVLEKLRLDYISDPSNVLKGDLNSLENDIENNREEVAEVEESNREEVAEVEESNREDYNKSDREEVAKAEEVAEDEPKISIKEELSKIEANSE